MNPQAQKTNEWGTAPASGKEQLSLGPMAKVAINAVRISIVVMVGLAILPFKLFAALISGRSGDAPGAGKDPWVDDEGDQSGHLYVNPINHDLDTFKTDPDQKPFPHYY